MTQEELSGSPSPLASGIGSEVDMGIELSNQSGSQGFGGSAQIKTHSFLSGGYKVKTCGFYLIQSPAPTRGS